VRAEIERRDSEDRQRPIGPLVRADDAVLVLGDGKSVEAILDEILGLLPPAFAG
jgi:cytidylate kinase